MLILRSHNYDPYWNLAAEDHLLDQVEQYGRVLFLWQSDHTVVVGKNQNPWLECSLDRLRKGRALLARRVSGGGAVYHDRGNLNYAFFQPRESYSSDAQFQLVASALKQLGIQASRLGSSSLAVDGKKISGNAFCFRKNGALHHGTLLVESDLDRLERFLETPPVSIQTRAVRSVPAPVTNLSAIVPGLSVDDVALALATEFSSSNGGDPVAQDPRMLDSAQLRELHHKYVSWEWCFGHTPPFDVEWTNEFEWGPVKVNLSVRKGMVSGVNVDAAGLRAEIGHIEGELLDCPFKASSLSRRIRRLIGRDGHGLLEQLAKWFEEQPLS